MNPESKREYSIANKLRSRVPRRGNVMNHLHQLMPTLIKNNTGSIIPPYSMVQVESSDTTNSLDSPMIGQDIRLGCILVDDSETDLFVSSGPVRIANGDTGMGYAGTVLPFASSANIGQYLIPQVGSLEPTVSARGPMVVYAKDTASGLVMARLTGTGAGQEIRFQIDLEYPVEYPDDVGCQSDDCADKQGNADTAVRAKVIGRSCGSTVSGFVTVVDGYGSFLEGREQCEIDGKIGHAVLMEDVDDYGATTGSCYWLITWIDWFEEVQMVEDVNISSTQIEIEKRNIEVWKQCRLEPEIVELVEC